ncbi:hypothetical protein NONI108955_21120 [Nocardia ninae]|jgi:hypothetical protein|uniref:Uncharacterized protein n=1 Tax=Nocardia ninae NBRC 108245 TaxID=1210091 RepID=A0A511MCG4_9NOCA|nr:MULTISPECIES: hypothetical protein [Nocardia]GEM37456.1 hypothetical protein NN4_19750 [Nocardia ninae NBRC 108245]
MTPCKPATLTPTLEVKVSPTGYTTVAISPDRTLLKLRESDAGKRTDLATAALIIRARIGAVDRTWKGNPMVTQRGVVVVLTNRMMTRERSFVVSRTEIIQAQRAWAQMADAA